MVEYLIFLLFRKLFWFLDFDILTRFWNLKFNIFNFADTLTFCSRFLSKRYDFLFILFCYHLKRLSKLFITKYNLFLIYLSFEQVYNSGNQTIYHSDIYFGRNYSIFIRFIFHINMFIILQPFLIKPMIKIRVRLGVKIMLLFLILTHCNIIPEIRIKLIFLILLKYHKWVISSPPVLCTKLTVKLIFIRVLYGLLYLLYFYCFENLLAIATSIVSYLISSNAC